MTTYDDNLLASRFAALAPEPLPGDWGDVLDRAGAVPSAWSRLAPSLWRGSRRRMLVVVLAAAVLVAAVGTAAYGTVRILFLDQGFVGLPPEGATPSTPERGELVLSWLGRSAIRAERDNAPFPPLMRVFVYADGRIIWSEEVPSSRDLPERANEVTSGYLEQRLTPKGVELLRSELVATGLFERSLSLLDPHAVSFWGGVNLRRDGRVVDLEWMNQPDVPGIGAGFTAATPEQLSALRRVDALITDPESVLPSSAWAVRKIRAYVPSHYEVCMVTSPPKDVSQILSLLPAEAADVLRGKSLERSEGDSVEAREGGIVVVIGRSVTYCSKLTTEETREVAVPLSGVDRIAPDALLAYRLGEPDANGDPTTWISFEPIFPHGQATSSDSG